MNGEQQMLILSLGGNEKNTESCFEKAIELLENRIGKTTLTSSIYTSEAWGFENPTPDFLNQVIALETDQNPKKLLEITQKIEIECGRTQKTQNTAYQNRVLDIDILFLGNTLHQSNSLTIPHYLIEKRTFILKPLSEILPNFIHPVLKKTVKELLLSQPDDTSVKLHDK